MTKDAATSAAQEEMERLQQELDDAQDTIASLRGRLDAEESENQRLQSELAELRLASVKKKSPVATKDMSTLATSQTRHRLRHYQIVGRVLGYPR